MLMYHYSMPFFYAFYYDIIDNIIIEKAKYWRSVVGGLFFIVKMVKC